MPIFAKNMIVGAKKAPTVPEKENKQVKTLETVKLEAKKKIIIQEELPSEDEKKYIYKEDGVLVRHINTKSHYLRDVLNLDSEN